MIRLQIIAATHAIQTHSTVVGVDEIRKDIEVFVQHPTVHAGIISIRMDMIRGTVTKTSARPCT